MANFSTEPIQRIATVPAGHPDRRCPHCLAGVDHVFAQCVERPAAPHPPTRYLPHVPRTGRQERHDTKEFCAIAR
ncbi:hypothetical protein [Nocardia altamirensis]|uniref:hypothetical protein n=1 Tax=Nocardia altamirensis TaxID=472158 RepID=UPI00114CD70F|nr:hypothetical protein [Nocardia altamirensis]